MLAGGSSSAGWICPSTSTSRLQARRNQSSCIARSRRAHRCTAISSKSISAMVGGTGMVRRDLEKRREEGRTKGAAARRTRFQIPSHFDLIPPPSSGVPFSFPRPPPRKRRGIPSGESKGVSLWGKVVSLKVRIVNAPAIAHWESSVGDLPLINNYPSPSIV